MSRVGRRIGCGLSMKSTFDFEYMRPPRVLLCWLDMLVLELELEKLHLERALGDVGGLLLG